jgi:hypothetical protein
LTHAEKFSAPSEASLYRSYCLRAIRDAASVARFVAEISASIQLAANSVATAIRIADPEPSANQAHVSLAASWPAQKANTMTQGFAPVSATGPSGVRMVNTSIARYVVACATMQIRRPVGSPVATQAHCAVTDFVANRAVARKQINVLIRPVSAAVMKGAAWDGPAAMIHSVDVAKTGNCVARKTIAFLGPRAMGDRAGPLFSHSGVCLGGAKPSSRLIRASTSAGRPQ